MRECRIISRLTLSVCVLVLGVMAVSPDAAALTSVIEVNGPTWLTADRSPGPAGLTAYYAPHAVFFEGWKSEPRSEIVEYIWDFGDGSEPFSGFNAAHVYEQPGNYTATLTVTDWEGHSASAAVNIEVWKRNGTTYYVDSVLGNDSNAGTSPGTGAWKTATHAFGGMASSRYRAGDEILFKRGQTFEMASGAVNISHWQGGYGYMFGAYGNGNKPIIQVINNDGGSVINCPGTGLRFVTLTDLSFNCTPPGGTPVIFWNAAAGGCNILWLRIDIKNFEQGWLVYDTDRCYVVDCTSYNSVITHFYSKTHRIALLGNTMDYSGNHVVYGSVFATAVVDGNVFSRPAFGRCAFRVAVNTPDTRVSNIWVSNNQMLGWIDPETKGSAHNGGGTRYNYILVQFGASSTGDKRGEWMVFEKNLVSDAECLLYISAWEHGIVRENSFVTNDYKAAEKIHIGHLHAWDERPNYDIQIVDNEFRFANAQPESPSAMFVVWPYLGPEYQGRSAHENIVIARNIVRLPTTDYQFLSVPEDAAQYVGVTSENNLIYCPTDTQSVYKKRSTPPKYYTLSQWRLLTGNDLATQIYTNPNLPVPGWARSPALVKTGPIPVQYDRVAPSSGSGLREVRLWARFNNESWADTGLRASGASGQFSYAATRGGGRYYFATQAVDAAGNASLAPTGPGATSTYYTSGAATDTTAPNPGVLTAPASSSVSPIVVTYTGAADESGGSGLKSVELWVKKGSAGTWAPTGLKQAGASGSFSYIVSEPGAQTYYFSICAEDNVGNVSPLPSGNGQAATLFSNVPEDTIAPTTGSLNVPAVTKTSPVSITYSGVHDEGGSGLKRVVLWAKMNGGSWLSTGQSSTQASGSFSYIPSAGDGHYEFALRAEDHAGNLSPMPSGAGAPCLFDTTPPAVGTVTAPQYAKATPVKVSYSGVSDGSGSGLKKVYFWFRKDGGAWQNSNLSLTSASGTFNSSPSQNGTYEYALRVEDNAGNLSPLPAAAGQASTIYDTVLPSLGALSAPSQESAPPISVTYSGVKDDRSGVKTVYLWFKKGNANWQNSGLASNASAGSFAFTGMTGNDTYYFALRVEDQAGNITALPSGSSTARTVYDTRFSPGTASSPQYATTAPITVTYSGARAEGSAIKSVRLWYKKGLSGTWANSGLSASGSSGQFSFSALSGDETYCFALQAENTQGALTPAPQSGGGDTRTIYDTTPPNPGNLASPEYSRQGPITASYSGASDEGSGLKQVRLWFKKGYGGVWRDSGLRSTGSEGSFSFNQMSGDDAYFFFLQAEDNAGLVSAAPSDALVFGGG